MVGEGVGEAAVGWSVAAQVVGHVQVVTTVVVGVHLVAVVRGRVVVGSHMVRGRVVVGFHMVGGRVVVRLTMMRGWVVVGFHMMRGWVVVRLDMMRGRVVEGFNMVGGRVVERCYRRRPIVEDMVDRSVDWGKDGRMVHLGSLGWAFGHPISTSPPAMGPCMLTRDCLLVCLLA